LSDKGQESISRQGVYVTEPEDEYTGYATPLIDGTGACAYINWDRNGISYCGIEKAFLDGNISFRKPVSCHLYHVRVKVNAGFILVNYDEWDICDTACKLGESLQVPVYRFVKDALVRRLGEETYQIIEAAALHAEKHHERL
jgi:hypothetical protein